MNFIADVIVIVVVVVVSCRSIDGEILRCRVIHEIHISFSLALSRNLSFEEGGGKQIAPSSRPLPLPLLLRLSLRFGIRSSKEKKKKKRVQQSDMYSALPFHSVRQHEGFYLEKLRKLHRLAGKRGEKRNARAHGTVAYYGNHCVK